MKLKLVLSLLLVIFVLTCSTNFAQQEDMMKKWQEYMTPGEVHQGFAKMAGDWKATVKMFGPSGEEMSSEATANLEMILGGRFMKSSFKGTAMGMPFEGMGLDGYNNITKEYWSTWVDNTGTGIMLMIGKWDEATKSVIYVGSATDPMTGKEQPTKSIFKMIDDNHTVSTMFNIINGQDVKMMEIAYSR